MGQWGHPTTVTTEVKRPMVWACPTKHLSLLPVEEELVGDQAGLHEATNDEITHWLQHCAAKEPEHRETKPCTAPELHIPPYSWSSQDSNFRRGQPSQRHL